jgi:hypothetical protein
MENSLWTETISRNWLMRSEIFGVYAHPMTAGADPLTIIRELRREDEEEVWYSVEFKRMGQDDWYPMNEHHTLEEARATVDRCIQAMTTPPDRQIDYCILRKIIIVRKTFITEPPK